MRVNDQLKEKKHITKKEARYIYKLTARLSIITVILIIAGYFIIPLIFNAIPQRSVNIKINYAIGETFYKEDNSSKWEKAKIGLKIGGGYELKALSNSLLDIQISDDNFLRLSSNSTMKFSKAKIKDLSMKLTYGSLYGIFKKIDKSHSIKFNTPTSVASVRGTKICIEASENRTTGYCLTGKLNLSSKNSKSKSVTLNPKMKSSTKKNEAPVNPRAMTQNEINRVRNVINSIYRSEALFASNHINFEIGSAEISKSSYDELNKISKMLLKTGKKVRVEGNTDSSGNPAYNKNLSLKRAKSIKEYLTIKGVPSERIEVFGHGGERPLFSNKTKEGKKLNRRVDFIIF